MSAPSSSSSLRYFTNPKDLTFTSPILVTHAPTLSTYTTIPKEKLVLEEFWNLVRTAPMVWDPERKAMIQDVNWFTQNYREHVLCNGMTVAQFCLNYILRHHTKRTKPKKKMEKRKQQQEQEQDEDAQSSGSSSSSSCDGLTREDEEDVPEEDEEEDEDAAVA